MILALSRRETCFSPRLALLVASVSACFLIPKFHSGNCFGDEDNASTAETREVELKYMVFLAKISLQATGSKDSDELQFWKSVSNLKDGRLVVWSVLDREYGAKIESAICRNTFGPASLFADGKACNVWLIKEPSSHELRHRQLRASLRHQAAADRDPVDYTCVVNSVFRNGDWEFVSFQLIRTSESAPHPVFSAPLAAPREAD